jgi:outer membrane protein TolC
MRARLAATLCTVLALGACSFAPAYKVPDSAPPTTAYKESGDWKPAQPADSQDRGAWWTIFQDPALDVLEAQLADANQDLKAAYARLLQARAVTRIARADLFPTLSLGAAATRSRSSVNSPRFPPGAQPVANNFDLEADLSYEIDVWGRVRNAVASARANQQASAADLATLNLAIHAELAGDYFSLRSQAEHAIAVLLGQNPSAFHMVANPLFISAVPPPIDPGLPSSLLERRPDVAAAERRTAAANAQIGVARAAYFPVFSLAAAAGFDSSNASNWLTAPSRLWSAGPAAGVLTVFDAGRHRAQTAQAKAFYDEQVADYRNTVLNAYREVEDNLAALRQLEQESVSEAAAVQATATALEQAQYRYKAGLVTYLEVSIAENTALQAQLANVSIQLRRMSASVLLVKALGGGWRGTDTPSAAFSTRRGSEAAAH